MKRKGFFLKALAAAMAVCLAFSAQAPVFAEETAAASEQAEGTLIFKGDTNESYESNDASWLLNAADDDVITVVYTCTIAENAGWGVLGWGATVNDVWTDGPSLSSSETNATDTMVASITVADFKKTMKITDSSVVSFIKLGAWNGGKIISLTISGAENAPTVEGAEEIVLEAPEELTGDYLYMIEEPTTIKIWPGDYLYGYIPGTTIHMTIEMESNGAFNGGIGTCVNNWAWQQETFESDSENNCTLKLFITPIQDNFQFQIWWMGGTQVGIKSITVEKAINYTPVSSSTGDSGSGSGSSDTPARDPYAGDPNAAHSGYVDMSDSSWWTERPLSLSELIGDVDPATVTSIVFNGDTNFVLGYKNTTGDATADANDPYWSQPTGIRSYTATNMNLGADYYAKICLSKGDGVSYRFTWDVYTNGATSGGSGGSGNTPSNIAHDSYTFDVDLNGQNEAFNFDLYDYFPDLQIGDQVKISAAFSSSGWYGGAVGCTSSSAADGNWDSVGFNNNDASLVSLTATVKYDGSNGGNVTIWWIGGGDATVDLTFEKLVD